MKDSLVTVIVDLALAVLMGVFAVLNFCDGDIVYGIIEAVICIANLMFSLSFYKKYRKIRPNKYYRARRKDAEPMNL